MKIIESAQSRKIASESAQTLPRDTTNQAHGILYGHLHRSINRWTGLIILAFVLLHIPLQAVVHVPALAGVKAQLPWLLEMQGSVAVTALLFGAITFHTLHGLKLIAMELGIMWVNYRQAFWVISGLSVAVMLLEVLRHVG